MKDVRKVEDMVKVDKSEGEMSQSQSQKSELMD